MKKLISILSALVLGVSTMIASNDDNQFGVKGFYLDCRSQVITMEAMYDLVDDLEAKGLNTLLLEWEGTFPFEKHATLCNEYMHSKKEVEDFIAYSTTKGIDVIPLQNCFGHAEYILRHNRYYSLREDPSKEISMVCPLKHQEAKPIFKEIFEEVAALHPSKYFHIGADETFLLGTCQHCKPIADNGGKSRLFVDYVNEMVELVLEMGKIPVIWADIILKYPEAVDQLSDELIFVDWNYGWDVNRFGDLQHLFDAGVKMWGASALRSGPDNMYLTQWWKHFYNLHDFIPHSRKSGYEGLINTSWSVSGGYGYHYDSSGEIMSMQPIRQVYPTQAFNILLEAYAQSLEQVEPLDVEKFILDYGVSRFGVTAEEAQKLLHYMQLPQEVFGRNGKDKKSQTTGEVIAETKAVLDEFSTLKPKRNKWEYDHLKLMLEMRLNYVEYKDVEAIYDNKKFSGDAALGAVGELAKRMERIYKESEALQKRFVKLNKGYLKEGQWEMLRETRSEKLESLYFRLKNFSEKL